MYFVAMERIFLYSQNEKNNISVTKLFFWIWKTVVIIYIFRTHIVTILKNILYVIYLFVYDIDWDIEK